MAESQLDDLKTAIGRYPLDEVLLGLNRACRSWFSDDRPWVAAPLDDLEPRSSVFRWIAAETARHAVAWCPVRSKNSGIAFGQQLGPDALRLVMNLAANTQLELAHARSPEQLRRFQQGRLLDGVSKLLYPQILLQRSSPFRVGMAFLMYRDAPSRRHDRNPKFPLAAYRGALERALDCRFDRFLQALMQISGASQSENPRLSMDRLVAYSDSRFDGHLYRWDGSLLLPAVVAVLARLSAGPRELIARMQKQTGRDDDLAVVDAPNPLLDHPIVRVFSDYPDCAIAPVPHLVLEWLYEPLVDLLFQHFDREFTSNHLSQVFEEYVGLLLEKAAPDQRAWLFENELTPGYCGRVVDWAREFETCVVFVDAKRCFVRNIERYRGDQATWDRCERTWIDGIRQSREFWLAVREGRVSAVPPSPGKPCVAVIVTQGDSEFRTMQESTRQAISEGSGAPDEAEGFHWLVISLDRLERTCAAWSSRDIEWLPAILLRAAQGREREVLDTVEVSAQGPLWEELERMVEDLKRSAGHLDSASE